MARRKVNKLHADRQAENRAVIRFLLSGVASLAVVAIVIWSVLELQDSQTLPIRSVEVKSEFIRISEQQIKAVVAENKLGGFFDTDVDAITNDMRKLPWLETVAVRRVWPDTLQLTISERRAIARWNETSLVTADATVFSPDVESYPVGLPSLVGPAGTEKNILMKYITIKADLQALGLKIDELKLDHRRAWTVKLDDGTSLDLGRKQINTRLQRFVSIYKKFIAEQKDKIDVVDLRYTNGFAIRWKNESKHAVKKAQLG